ncbi:MAG: hypothetical protein ACKOD9_14560, partial [Rubrivivax sp.]
DDDSPDVEAGPVKGAPLPNVRWGEGFLLDHLCGAGAGRFALIVDEQATLAGLKLAGSGVARGAVGTALRPAALQTLVVPAGIGRALGLAGLGSALLVRPDQHVCARWYHVTPQRLQAAMHRALGLSWGLSVEPPLDPSLDQPS